jgi:hypothetical protein
MAELTPTAFDKEQLLRILFYHMNQDTREMLMREVPGAYNRYVGQVCAVVGRARDNPAFNEV